MSIYSETKAVLVREDPGGNVIVETTSDLRKIEIPGVTHGGWYWGTDDIPTLPAGAGGRPEGELFPGPGQTRFGIFEFAANSAGKVDYSQDLPDLASEFSDPEMHRTDTVDYEVILSGSIDLEFPGGVSVTLHAGDFLVLAGVPHAWKNRYDEPCRYIAILVGANRSA